MKTSADRLIARVGKITRRRPSPPRELREDTTRNLLTWKPPIASGAPFTHYRVRIDHDGGEPDFEVSAGQRSLEIPSGSRVFLTAYNATNGLESTRVSSEISGGGGGTGNDIAARFVFDFPEGDPVDIDSDISINPCRIRLKAGKRIQLSSAVVQTHDTVDGDLVFDVLVSTDGGGTWNTIFNATFPTAVDGTKTGTPVTDFTIPYLNIDDLLRLDVTATGSNTTVSGELILLGTVVSV